MVRITKGIPIEHLLGKQMNLWEVRKKLDIKKKEHELSQEPWHQGFITISRLFGSGGGEIAQRVAELLDWQLFDRELVHEIANTSKMRKHVIESLDEKRQNDMQRWVQGLFDSDTLSSDRYLKHLIRVIFTIASHGRAVIIGRGANFVLESQKGVRVKIHAPEELRILRIKDRGEFSEKEARKIVREADSQRLAFIRQYFHQDADDPSGYDLVINTGDICPELAAHLIKETLISKYKTLRGLGKIGGAFIHAG